MRILIISGEVWQDGTNGGNVLSNIFDGVDAEFAQIYCSPGIPNNKLCNKYYQITDKTIIDSIMHKTNTGKAFFLSTVKNDDNIDQSMIKKHLKLRLTMFFVAREILWAMADIYNDSLKEFIDEFQPDVIFAPCYASHRMLHLDRWVHEYTGKPMISYISDDNYSLRQLHISPLYWIDRFVLRYNMRRTFKHYSLTYTMTEEQKTECENKLNANMKILRKSGIFEDCNYAVNETIKFIFAGGIYCGRWKTLISIAEAIKEANRDGKKAELHIYTRNDLSNKQGCILNDGENSYVHDAVSQEEMFDRYSKSDVALHVESFDLKNRLLTRLSFSTKIVDCLGSGCAVMAVAWENHAGLRYLKREDAAICVDDKKKIAETVHNIINDKKIILEYKEKAKMCLLKNHDPKQNREMIQQDFNECICEDIQSKGELTQ